MERVEAPKHPSTVSNAASRLTPLEHGPAVGSALGLDGHPLHQLHSPVAIAQLASHQRDADLEVRVCVCVCVCVCVQEHKDNITRRTCVCVSVCVCVLYVCVKEHKEDKARRQSVCMVSRGAFGVGGTGALFAKTGFAGLGSRRAPPAPPPFPLPSRYPPPLPPPLRPPHLLGCEAQHGQLVCGGQRRPHLTLRSGRRRGGGVAGE